MWQRGLIILAVALAVAPALAEEKQELKSQKDKLSYSIGLDIGTNFKNQSIEINPDILAEGLKDALSGEKALLTNEEARKVLADFQQEMRAKAETRHNEAVEKNKKEGAAFLAGNKTQKGVVTLPSGLQYKIITEGSGPKPKADDTVTTQYRGTLVDGTEFDSSFKRGQPATFPVSGVIRGWTEALQLMPVGSKWQLFVPPDLAYGPRGAGQTIGPEATLIFEVELLSIQEPGKAEKNPE